MDTNGGRGPIRYRGPGAGRPVSTARSQGHRSPRPPPRKVAVSERAGGRVTSPMPGMILAVKVKVGDTVRAGDVVAVLESMKMQNEVRSPHGGLVKEILVHEGDLVKGGAVLMLLERPGR